MGIDYLSYVTEFPVLYHWDRLTDGTLIYTEAAARSQYISITYKNMDGNFCKFALHSQ